MCKVVHRIGSLDIGDISHYCYGLCSHIVVRPSQACEEAVERVKHEVPSLERRILYWMVVASMSKAVVFEIMDLQTDHSHMQKHAHTHNRTDAQNRTNCLLT